MEFTLMLEIIGTLGFPVAAVIALCWFIYKIYKASEKREAELRKEIKESQTINGEAIKTLALYAERLGNIESDVKEIKNIVLGD
jgi:F0F1-type ATP synthase membrane subunit b/b'